MITSVDTNCKCFENFAHLNRRHFIPWDHIMCNYWWTIYTVSSNMWLSISMKCAEKTIYAFTRVALESSQLQKNDISEHRINASLMAPHRLQSLTSKRIRLPVALAVHPSSAWTQNQRTNGKKMVKYQSYPPCVCAPAAFSAYVAIGNTLPPNNRYKCIEYGTY